MIQTDETTLARLKPRDGKPLVFLAIPTYDRRMDIGTADAIVRATSTTRCVVRRHNAPLLAYNFNICWCDALNLRESLGVTHFCMLHADLIPSGDWLNDLMAELQRCDLDALSVVSPIKDLRGLTSTGLDVSGLAGKSPWAVRRITMAELFMLPETFNGDDAAAVLPGWPKNWPVTLCVNTGLLLIDLRKPWVEQVHFEIRDCIHRDPDTGLFEAFCEPEDWGFSRQMKALGVRYAATRKIAMNHIGSMAYDNASAWGTERSDSVGVVPEVAEVAVPDGVLVGA